MLKRVSLNWVDALVVGGIGLGVLGVFLVQSGVLTTSGQQVDGETDIQVVVGVFGAEIKDQTILIIYQNPNHSILNKNWKSLKQKLKISPLIERNAIINFGFNDLTGSWNAAKVTGRTTYFDFYHNETT